MSLSVLCNPLKRGEYLKIAISVKPNKTGGKNIQEFKIDDLAQIRLQFVQQTTPARVNCSTSTYDSCSSDSVHSDHDAKHVDTPYSIFTSMAIKKVDSAKDLRVKLNIQFKSYNYYEQLVCPDNWTEWIELGQVTTKVKNSSYKPINLEVSLTASKSEVITFAKLYDDTITTDFNISVKGGKSVVPMHRNFLLAHSDMFKTLFQSADFIDKKDFQVGIKVTDQTIQHLKDYIYLDVLPDDGLRMLLLLAKCYLFENLKSECIAKLVQMVTYQDLHSLITFACENNIPELAVALLEQTPQDVVHQAYLMRKRNDQKRSYTNGGKEEINQDKPMCESDSNSKDSVCTHETFFAWGSRITFNFIMFLLFIAVADLVTHTLCNFQVFNYDHSVVHAGNVTKDTFVLWEPILLFTLVLFVLFVVIRRITGASRYIKKSASANYD